MDVDPRALYAFIEYGANRDDIIAKARARIEAVDPAVVKDLRVGPCKPGSSVSRDEAWQAWCQVIPPTGATLPTIAKILTAEYLDPLTR